MAFSLCFLSSQHEGIHKRTDEGRRKTMSFSSRTRSSNNVKQGRHHMTRCDQKSKRNPLQTEAECSTYSKSKKLRTRLRRLCLFSHFCLSGCSTARLQGWERFLQISSSSPSFIVGRICQFKAKKELITVQASKKGSNIKTNKLLEPLWMQFEVFDEWKPWNWARLKVTSQETAGLDSPHC